MESSALGLWECFLLIPRAQAEHNPKSDGTQKFTDEVDELRAISSHMLGASEVQIPQNNLDNLQALREEYGTSETVDPPD
ncbi:hypothetical protein Tco_0396033 [Tanacetum coccineum]